MSNLNQDVPHDVAISMVFNDKLIRTDRQVGSKMSGDYSFKLVLRDSMFEFYFDQLLHFVITLDSTQTGVIGRVPASKEYVDGWKTTLYANVTANQLLIMISMILCLISSFIII